MLQNLLRRTTSSAASALSPNHPKDTIDDDYEVFSTPPSTPIMSSAPSSASSSYSESSSTSADPTKPISEGAKQPANANMSGPPSRRSSRPTSLLIDSDIAQEWTPDVQVDETESPNVSKRDIVHKEGMVPQTVEAGHGGVPVLSHSATSQQQQPLPDSTHTSSAGSEQSVSSNSMRSQYGSNTNNGVGEKTNGSVSSSSTASIGPSSSGSDTYTQRHAHFNGLYPSHALAEASQAHLRPQLHQSNSEVKAASPHHPHSHLDQRHQLSQSQSQPAYNQQPKSPCFVHSYLDKGASLTDWLRQRGSDMLRSDVNAHGPGGIGVAKGLQHNPNDASPSTAKNPTFQHTQHGHNHFKTPFAPAVPTPFNHQRLPSNEMGFSYQSSPSSSSPSDFDDEESNAGNLTRQLAETAVGVREMSKQLGE